MKLGEKLMFGFAILLAVGGVARGVKHIQAEEPKQARNYYEWSETSLQGHELYKELGCNNCHRALGSGEIGIAPPLDGTGTKRTLAWIQAYLKEPETLVPGTAHDGSLGPDVSLFSENKRELLASFLFALKANPGSPNYPRPPS